MHAQRFTRMLILGLVFLLALIPVNTVSAERPVVYSGSADENFMLDPQLCPGIEVWDHEVFTFRWTEHYDKQGNITSISNFVTGVDNIYNPENPDVVLSGKFTATFDVDDPQTMEAKLRGLPFHITVPGYGEVMLRAGLWATYYPDMHLAGHDSFTDPKDLAAFCSILAGN
jgi:hypothetical protein